jgi:hypothetical protein
LAADIFGGPEAFSSAMAVKCRNNDLNIIAPRIVAGQLQINWRGNAIFLLYDQR